MKKLLFLPLPAVLFLFWNCDGNRMKTPVQITVANESGVPVEIFVYMNSSEFVQKYALDNADSFTKEFVQKEGLISKGAEDFFEGDSVVIVFNEKRKLSYKCISHIRSEACQVEGNILNDLDPKWKQERLGELLSRSYT